MDEVENIWLRRGNSVYQNLIDSTFNLAPTISILLNEVHEMKFCSLDFLVVLIKEHLKLVSFVFVYGVNSLISAIVNAYAAHSTCDVGMHCYKVGSGRLGLWDLSFLSLSFVAIG